MAKRPATAITGHPAVICKNRLWQAMAQLSFVLFIISFLLNLYFSKSTWLDWLPVSRLAANAAYQTQNMPQTKNLNRLAIVTVADAIGMA